MRVGDHKKSSLGFHTCKGNFHLVHAVTVSMSHPPDVAATSFCRKYK